MRLMEGIGLPSLNGEIQELFRELDSRPGGLSQEEAADRLLRHGINALEQTRIMSDVEAFLSQFSNPLVIILLISAFLSYFLGEVSGAFIIAVLVLMSVSLQFYHERRSMKAAAELSRQVAVHATVLRDGVKQEVEIGRIVPGDVVFLSAGDIIPGDSRIIAANNLYVNQSTLTGESFPVEKKMLPGIQGSSLLTEMEYALFMGTSVTSGMGQALVVSTGKDTEIGKIAHALTMKPPMTDFEHGIKDFSILLVRIIIILVSVIFLINALMHKGFFESFLFAVAISVGLTPELLPMIMAINLANGAVAMAHKGVIVKWLASIQNFGSMDVLCSDKTGTLTEGELKLVGYQDSAGEPNEKIILFAYLNSVLQGGMKNPLDLAIVAEGKPQEADLFQKIDEVPFDFVRRMLTVIVEKGEERLLIVKGAPESVFAHCSHCYQDGSVQEFTEEIQNRVNEHFMAQSSQGHKVIAAAYKPVDKGQSVFTVQDEENLIFAGMLSFFDSPKSSVAETIRDINRLGVTIKILTGDNELITQKVCEEVGIPVTRILLGSEMDRIGNDALARIVDETSVFARLTPNQKDRIIHLLKRNGHVVGYIGDGINDAPSLRAADVGISVNNAVDVAKASAALILMDKSLAVLKDGVIEGRKTFSNTMKYIMMGTSSNFGNMFSMSVATVLVPFLPMLPVQVLLNNFLYDMSQIAIPTDLVDEEASRRPKRWDMTFIRHFMVVFGTVSSLFDITLFLLLIYVFQAAEPSFQTAWFIESLATQILVIYIIRSRHSIFRSRPSKWLIMTTLFSIIAGIVVTCTSVGSFFGFMPLSGLYFGTIAVLVMVYLLLVEYTKRWFFKRYGW